MNIHANHRTSQLSNALLPCRQKADKNAVLAPAENGVKQGNELDAQALREKALENLHSLRSLDAENEADEMAGLNTKEEHLGRALCLPC